MLTNVKDLVISKKIDIFGIQKKLVDMNTIITNDERIALIIGVALTGEKYLNEHNGNIDLDDDDAVEAMVWNDMKNEIF